MGHHGSQKGNAIEGKQRSQNGGSGKVAFGGFPNNNVPIMLLQGNSVIKPYNEYLTALVNVQLFFTT